VSGLVWVSWLGKPDIAGSIMATKLSIRSSRRPH
jgi:hypothetical protein